MLLSLPSLVSIKCAVGVEGLSGETLKLLGRPLREYRQGVLRGRGWGGMEEEEEREVVEGLVGFHCGSLKVVGLSGVRMEMVDKVLKGVVGGRLECLELSYQKGFLKRGGLPRMEEEVLRNLICVKFHSYNGIDGVLKGLRKGDKALELWLYNCRFNPECLRGIRRLQILQLRKSCPEGTEDVIISGHFPRLRRLVHDCNDRYNEGDSVDNETNCEKLCELLEAKADTLRDVCFVVSAAGVARVASVKLHPLCETSIMVTRATRGYVPEIMYHLASFESLVVIRLACFDRIFSLNMLATLPKLRMLRLERCTRTGRGAIKEFLDLTPPFVGLEEVAHFTSAGGQLRRVKHR